MKYVNDIYNSSCFRLIDYIYSHEIGINYLDYFTHIALLIIKPEAIICNKTPCILTYLKHYDFRTIYFKKCILTSSQIHSIWSNSWRNVSIEHIYINEKCLAFGECIILLLYYPHQIQKSASEYLTFLKGSAYSEDRNPYQLRSILEPINISLNYVHSSDNPKELIYEMSILFSKAEYREIANLITHKDNTELIIPKELFYSSPDYQDSRPCFEKILKHVKRLYSDAQDCIKQLMDIYNGKEKFTLDFILDLEAKKIICWNWDWIIIISSNISHKVSSY